MKSYQVIILIAAILGLLTVVGIGMIASITSDVTGYNPSADQATTVYGGVVIGFFIYIISIIISFAIKRPKIVGVITIIFSVIILFANGVFGLLGFILLLVGGIVALAYKEQQPQYQPYYEPQTRKDDKQERKGSPI